MQQEHSKVIPVVSAMELNFAASTQVESTGIHAEWVIVDCITANVILISDVFNNWIDAKYTHLNSTFPERTPSNKSQVCVCFHLRK